EVVQKWTRTKVINFLRDNADEDKLDLDEDDIAKIKNNKVKGSAFLELSKEDLLASPYNLPDGPARTIAGLIRNIKGEGQVEEPSILKQEVLELKKELESLRNLQKVFSIKASYAKKSKKFSWTVDFSNLSLKGLKTYIHKQLSFPDEVDPEDLILCASDDNAKNNEEQSLIDDESYEPYLKSCVATNSLSLKISVYTVQKPYSEWTLNAVCDIFELPTHYKDFPKFACGIDKLEDKKSQKLLLHLIEDLKIRRSTIRGDSEAYNSKFVLPFLVVASSVCGDKVKIYPEEYIQGKYGRGPVDFCMTLENIIISVLEVKKEDFMQGTAQIIVQLHSSLESSRKRKHEDEDSVIDKAYGIVTDSKSWFFFECSMDRDKPKYRIHSDEGTTINWSGNFEEGVTEVLRQIVWLVKDAEKLIELAKQKKAKL
ncbi:10229_t:CDS:2, partial [Gigaspora margarita]